MLDWSMLILASASPRRSELLRDLGLSFQVVPGSAVEILSADLRPPDICQINAYRKARAVAKHHPDALVIGADTLVCQGANLFGKPADLNHAFQMLSALQGREHEVITGVCLMHLREHRQRLFYVSTAVRFRPLRTSEIRRYLERINPLDKAGAYAIQEEGDMIIEAISGSYSNVVGLPLERLASELAAWEPSAYPSFVSAS